MNHQHKILCLDLGTKTGWCLISNDEFESGTINLNPRKDKSTPKNRGRFFNAGKKCHKFYTWLLSLTQHYKDIKEIYFEEVWGHKGVTAAHTYGMYLGILTMFCEGHGIKYIPIPVGTIKKTLTGKGNALKEEVINKLNSFGLNPKDDNEADAIAIAYHVLSSSN